MTSATDLKVNNISEDDISFTLKVFSITTFKTLGEIYSSKKLNPFIFIMKEITSYGEDNKLDAHHLILLDSLIAKLNRTFEFAAKSIFSKKTVAFGTGDSPSKKVLSNIGANQIDFFMSVITTVVKQTVNTVEVLNNHIVSVRLDYLDDDSQKEVFQDRHQVTVGFGIGDKNWIIDTFDSNPEIRPVVHVNGVPNPKLDESERLVCALLTSVALYISVEKALHLEHEVEAKNPVILMKAKMMADILGGDFRNYLSSALELHAASRPIGNNKAISDKDLAKIIQDEYRCTSNEADQVVMIFTEKPRYH